MSEAVIVGSGPNGLTAAAMLARAGVGVTVLEAEQDLGGGARSAELTLPGLIHDRCAAVQPMAVTSPAFEQLGLVGNGLDWDWAEVELAHPLEADRGAAMVRSIDATASGLGARDGAAWSRLFGRSAAGFEQLNEDLIGPVLHLPRHPLRLARFGAVAAMPASVVARAFAAPEARALFAGLAAHSYAPLHRPLSSAIGAALAVAGHHSGWPVPRGGAQSITDALAAIVRGHGGRIECGRRVTSLAELPPADAVMLDLAPSHVARLAGERLPDRVRRAYSRYRHGPGAFKLDFAVEGGVPWLHEPSRRACTVHVGGSFEEIAFAEREINRGRMPERPLVLVAQQHLADSSRSSGNVHPVWAYAHVPAGYEGDVSEAAIAQIERFAPGFRERVLATSTRSPRELTAENANLVGGDIINGANTPLQTVVRPRLTLSPYETGIPGVFICSAATPPGAGVHGLCGYNAARAALARLERA